MSKLALARAEAVHLFTVDRLPLSEIATRMVRSVEGVELLLKYAGVDPSTPQPAPTAPPPVPEAALVAAEPEPIVMSPAPEGLTGAALAEWLYDNTDASFEAIAASTGLSVAAVEAVANGGDASGGTPAPREEAGGADLLAVALRGAAAACAAPYDASAAALPHRVRVLAARSLSVHGAMRPGEASRACGIAHQAEISPSQLGKYGVSDEMIAAVVAHIATGAPVAEFPDPRPGAAFAKLKAQRLAEATRLYVDERLSFEAVGQRLAPPMAGSNVARMLYDAGVETRPRGTQGAVAGLRADGSPRKAPCSQPRPRLAKAAAPRQTVRLRQPSADVVRWSRAYVARGVGLDYLADLFDVDPEALERATEAA